MIIGERIRDLRVQKELSQGDIEARTGVVSDSMCGANHMAKNMAPEGRGVLIDPWKKRCND